MTVKRVVGLLVSIACFYETVLNVLKTMLDSKKVD